MEKNTQNNSSRREFLSATALVAAGIALRPLMTFAGGNAEAPIGEHRYQLNTPLDKRKLGSLEVSALGLGCMTMAGMYNPVPPKEEMVRLIRSAFDKGITFFDTAELYGPLLSEELVGEAVAPFRNEVVIASKFGWPGFESAKPGNIKKATENALRRLKTDRIDLYYLHRVSRDIPVEDVAGVIKDLIQEGKVLHFGLSEVSVETLRKAHAIQPVTALQSQYSLMERGPERNGVLDACEELGIGFVPWSPLNRGFLTGIFDEHSTFKDGVRSRRASFSPEALKSNIVLLQLVKDWAKKKGITPAQLSLGWLMAQKPFIVPIPGTTNPQHLIENMGCLNVKFTPEELSDFRSEFSKIELVGVGK